jgi:hypothetical protein
MYIQDKNEKKIMTVEDAAQLVSETLDDVAKRKTTLKHAMVVSRLAVALTKIYEVSNLRDRVEFLEQALKKRK